MADYVQYGSTASFSLPQIGGADADLIHVGVLDHDQTILVQPNTGAAGTIGTWTLGFDILVPAGELGSFAGLLQSDLSNTSDAELFLRADGGVGISSVYDGSFAFGTWERLVFTAETDAGVTVLNKYIDGELVGTQTLAEGRWSLDAEDGFLLLSDNDGESVQAYVSSVFFDDDALNAESVAALGGADADGFFDAAPGEGASQFDFAGGSLAATFGDAVLSAPQDSEAPDAPELEVVNHVMDVMKTPGSVIQIDLSDVFSRDDVTLAIENDDPSIVASAVIDGDVLTVTLTDALGHADFRLTATDADGNVASDNFRIRSAGANAYTIAVLPDTQDYTDASLSNGPPQTFYNMTQWLVDNKDSHNINFVAHVGDITQNNLDYQWVVAETALRKLDGVIPYSVLPGNHDQASGGTAADHSSIYLDEIFSPENQAATSATFGGVYDQEPDRGVNNYHTFTATDGTKWLVLSMEFGPRDDVIRWGQDVIESHLDHQVIVVSHALTNFAGRHDPTSAPLYDEGAGYDYGIGRDPEGANDGETVWREILNKYPNVAFTFSGHIFGDGAETDVSYSQHGNRIVESLVNYQNGISREITGNGDEALGSAGGNGAIRLVTIDPDNDRVTTETYFTEFDDYLDGFRVKPETDRDGLTGLYRGHEETFENWDLSTPDIRAVADAGDDRFVAAAAGAKVATVSLDAGGTADPGGVAAGYEWLDADGVVLATGETADIDLGIGRHALTLRVTDTAGHVTTDDMLVVVTGDTTLLADNFNDGDTDGWMLPSASDALAIGTPESFGLPSIPGGAASVARIPALSPTKALTVTPNFGAPEGTLISDFSLVFDVLVEDGQGSWASFVQLQTANADDGELFLNNRGDGTGGIGIGGNYQGAFQYGEWQRVGFVFEAQDANNTLLSKYIDGELVGSQIVSGDRFKLDAGRGLLLFSDENGETSETYVSSVLLTGKVFTAEEMAALGGADADGILDAAPDPTSVQFDFNDDSLAATFGVPTLGYGAVGSGTGNFLVKGTVFSRNVDIEGLPAPEARVYDMSDAAGNILTWGGEGSEAWSDYVVEMTIRSTDNDGIGAVFYYQDPQNHYRFEADGETNTRTLVRVRDGVETVLATATGGTHFNVDQDLKIAVVGDEITVFLDGRSVFGGPVADADPLTGGTIGFWSDAQRSSEFDTVTVNTLTLTAHAGDDVRLIDTDGDGTASVTLHADSSFGPAGIVSWAWTDAEGNLRATGEAPTIDLEDGLHALTLTVTDADGNTATDLVKIEVVAQDRVLLAEDFDGAAIPAGWRIVDEGEFGGVGPDGTASDWTIADGALVQNSDLQSRELTWNGATNADYWQRGWSPLGDGVNVLRVGTYALYEGEGAYDWDNYSIEARIETPDDDGLGFLIHYVDDRNYYKLELDADGTYDRSPGNGAGSLFSLIRMHDGIEEILGQVPQKYTPGEAFDLRVDIVDQKISAFINGDGIFAYAIEDHTHEKGTVGLYSWGSEGVSFDDVRVVSLDESAPEPGPLSFSFWQDGGGTPQGTVVSPPPADAALVAAKVSVTEAGAGMLVENTGIWNEIKAAVMDEYQSAWGTDFTIANFVDVRADLSAADESLDVTVVGAKRGELAGGAAADHLTWVAFSNEATWSNAIAIDAGAGDDVVEVRAIASSTLDNALLADNASPRNGTHWKAGYNGGSTTAQVDGGAGDDVIRAFDLVRLIATGGAGDDVGQGGDGGQNVWVLSGAAADYDISEAGGTWTIADITGADGTDTITGFEFLRFGDGLVLELNPDLLIA